MDRLAAYIPLNFALLANPVNWAIVTLMVLLAGSALHLIVLPTPQNKD